MKHWMFLVMVALGLLRWTLRILVVIWTVRYGRGLVLSRRVREATHGVAAASRFSV